ncbi:lactate utilization protein [Senegalia massiliensis]|uniref:Lactate utilization protein n=1 Tax=Senegalia massiliensis TaxID=1720316 RepID=A0A845R026_9CLOT|nr:lactate utilization protein [Senegalia massiliensis]
MEEILLKNLVDITINNLENNGFQVEYFDNINIAKDYLLSKIDIETDVGIGGSMTIFDSKIHEELIKKGNKVYWHWLCDSENKNTVLRNASNSNIYLSSSNAITSEGKLINIDGVGNRVTSMVYGHDKVYILVGINKIVENNEEAINRIKEVTCPKNAERLNLNTPCRHTGKCNDCNSLDRMCNVTVILEKKPMKTDIEIIIINQKLGY